MSETFAKDYIEVKDRIAAFYAKYPEGSLQSEMYELSEGRVVMRAYAYRKPDDERPGVGYSSLEIPGRTPYTKGSEIENCETSAWGRAIASLGFEVHRGVASAEEVRNKTASPAPRRAPRQSDSSPAAGGADNEPELVGSVARAGTVKAGTHDPSDLLARQVPEGGHRVGFALETDDGKKVPQVIITGDLAAGLMIATGNLPLSLKGKTVTVEGDLYRVPWVKDGKQMPRFQRLMVARLETADWSLPARPAPAAAEPEENDLDALADKLFAEPAPVA